MSELNLRDEIASIFDHAGDNSPRANREINLINFDIDPDSLPESIHLSLAEQRQMRALQEHMKLCADTEGGFENMPEKSLSRMIAKCTPAVQKALELQRRAFNAFDSTGGRVELFGEAKPLNRDDFDESTKRIADRFEEEEITAGIHERMGTPTVDDADTTSEPTLRETLEVFTPEDMENG